MKSLKDTLKRRFQFLETMSFLSVATLLDPRFKSKYLSTQQLEKSTQDIINFLNDNSINFETSTVMEKVSEAESKRRQKKQKRGSSLWEKHDSASHQPQDENIFEKEIKIYISEPLSDRKTNIYEYWNSCSFANLKAAARKYLSAPPTSVSSEQLFSAAGQLYSDRRSNLKGINAEKLLFCHYNIKTMNFEY